jgi:hypothetical protein
MEGALEIFRLCWRRKQQAKMYRETICKGDQGALKQIALVVS